MSNKYIPSEFKGISVTFPSKKIKFKVKLTFKKKIETNFKKINDISENLSLDEFDSYKKAKNLKPFLNYTVPYWIFEGLIHPYKFVNYTKEISNLYKKNNDFFEKLNIYLHNLDKKYKRFELYDNISTITYYNNWEMYRLYPDFIPLDKKLNCLFIFSQLVLSPLEEFCVFREKYSKYSASDNIDALELTDFLIGSQLETPYSIKKKFLDKFNHIHYKDLNIDICNPINFLHIFQLFNSSSKNKHVYDIIEISLVLFDYETKNITDYKNTQLNFVMILICFQFLKKGGHFKINLRNTSSKLTSDLLFLLTQYFNTVHITKSSSGPLFTDYKNIICIGFKIPPKNIINQLLDLQKRWYELDNSCGRLISGKETKYIYSILDFEKNPISFYKSFTYFNTLQTKRKTLVFQKIIHLYNTFYALRNNSNELNKLEDSIREKQIAQSILWLQKNDIRVKHKYQLNNIIQKKIESELFNFKIQAIQFTFKHKDKNKDKLPIHFSLKSKYTFKLSDCLIDLENNLKISKRYIDTRDSKKWYHLTKHIYIYEKLKNFLRDHFTQHNTSRAFLKMYEMLFTFDLLNKNNKTHHTFHVCELPGQFIVSTNHYLKTATKNKIFNWKGQSLNPNSDINKKKYGDFILNDFYGLYKKYKTQWNFAQDDTGDILINKNIKFYKSLCKHVDLLTFDCGLPSFSTYDMLYQQDKLAHIQFACILFIFNNLPVGKNFIIKVFNPLTQPPIIQSVYLLYCLFDSLHFYKPSVHQSSSEFYIIGKNYKGIPKKLLNYLFKKNNNFNIKYGLFPQSDVSSYFMKQFEKILKSLIQDNIDNIYRSLYYFDNPDLLEKHQHFIDTLKEDVIEQWITKFKFKKINTENSLI